jgi:hypothetical protein
VLPAHQRLAADQGAGAQVDDRLHVQPQLAVADGGAQLPLEVQPLAGVAA